MSLGLIEQPYVHVQSRVLGFQMSASGPHGSLVYGIKCNSFRAIWTLGPSFPQREFMRPIPSCIWKNSIQNGTYWMLNGLQITQYWLSAPECWNPASCSLSLRQNIEYIAKRNIEWLEMNVLGGHLGRHIGFPSLHNAFGFNVDTF